MDQASIDGTEKDNKEDHESSTIEDKDKVITFK